jgi:hypothetical protein
VPVRPPVALAGIVLTVLLSGCSGTDPAASAGSAPTSPTTTAPASSAPTPAPASGQRIEVTVTGGQAAGDTGRVPVAAGEQVTLVVTSDAADEVHVHGYDLSADLTPGTPAEISFAADLPGVFEVELHEAGTLLLSLQVG